MKLLIASFLCCATVAFAQLEGPAWLGQQYVVSSGSVFDPSTVFQAYWKPSADNYTTNAGTTTLTDLGAGSYHLTNTTAANLPTRVEAGFDGQDYLDFDGSSDYLRQVAMTNSQPNEVWAVLRLRADAAGVNVLFSSTTSTEDQNATQNTTSLQMNAGSSLSLAFSSQTVTNRWLLWHWVFNGASSSIRTNDGVVISGNAGNNQSSGITIGAGTGGTFNAPINVAWIGTISSNLPTGATSNLVWGYFKTNFPTLNLP